MVWRLRVAIRNAVLRRDFVIASQGRTQRIELHLGKLVLSFHLLNPHVFRVFRVLRVGSPVKVLHLIYFAHIS